MRSHSRAVRLRVNGPPEGCGCAGIATPPFRKGAKGWATPALSGEWLVGCVLALSVVGWLGCAGVGGGLGCLRAHSCAVRLRMNGPPGQWATLAVGRADGAEER